MSGVPDNYVPDARLTAFFDAVEREDDEIKADLCPAFTHLADGAPRYSQEVLLGRGGLKEVYKAFDAATQQWVALARLRADRGLQYYDLFVREAWRISALSHPNIIKIHDAGADAAGRPYFTMDLKRGVSLADLIQQKTPRVALLEIFQKVCDAVAYAHSQGVIHLDLKPENIQCDCFGEVLVCDWGLARSLSADADEEVFETLSRERVDTVTMMGPIRGTLGYMSPEQAVAGGQMDERADVYALGCILHTILCGEPPFSGSVDVVLKKTVSSSVPPLRARFPDRSISESIEAVVLKATALDPADRYASAIQLKQEIHKFLSGFSTEAETTGFYKEARLFVRRNRKASAVALISLVLLTVLSVLFVQRLGRQQLATEEERLRANRLLAEVNVLSSDYQQLSEQSSVSKKQLADELARSANSLKNLGIFFQPVSTVEQARELVQMALELDPACAEARWQGFTLHCLQLNYQAALQEVTEVNNIARNHYVRLAKLFSEYAFDRKNRPTERQLQQVFERAYQEKLKLSGHLERIFIYHAATSDETDHSHSLAAYLAYMNGGPAHFSMTYQPQPGRLHIRSDQDRLVLNAKSGKTNGGLLRFISFRSLKLSVSGEVTLQPFNRVPIETLDISDAPHLGLKRPVMLPQLKKLVVRRGQFSPSELRERIMSQQSFEIIEQAPPPPS